MYSTEGIVLKRIDTGEADSLFTIYTKDFGKMRMRAQGVKKEGAKLRGHLETLSHVNLSFVIGKNGERLTGATLLNFWPGIRSDYLKSAAASSMMDLIDKNCFDGEKDERLWELLIAALGELEQGNFDDLEMENFIKKFKSNFLKTQGHADY